MLASMNTWGSPSVPASAIGPTYSAECDQFDCVRYLMQPEIRPLPSTSKTSPGRRTSRRTVESSGLSGSLGVAGSCSRAIKRPTLSNIQPMRHPSFLVRSLMAGGRLAVRLRSYTPSLMMERWTGPLYGGVFDTLHLVETGIPWFGDQPPALHSRTANLSAVCRQADIIVAALVFPDGEGGLDQARRHRH